MCVIRLSGVLYKQERLIVVLMSVSVTEACHYSTSIVKNAIIYKIDLAWGVASQLKVVKNAKNFNKKKVPLLPILFCILIILFALNDIHFTPFSMVKFNGNNACSSG